EPLRRSAEYSSNPVFDLFLGRLFQSLFDIGLRGRTHQRSQGQHRARHAILTLLPLDALELAKTGFQDLRAGHETLVLRLRLVARDVRAQPFGDADGAA